MREGNSLLCKANEKYYYALRKNNKRPTTGQK